MKFRNFVKCGKIELDIDGIADASNRMKLVERERRGYE